MSVKFDLEAWSDAEVSLCCARDSLSILTEVLYTDGHKVESGAAHASILLIEYALGTMESGRIYGKKKRKGSDT